MTPSSVLHGHRQSSSMNDLASKAGYSPIDLAFDEDSSTSFELGDTARTAPTPRPATAPLSPRIRPISLTKSQSSMDKQAIYALDTDEDGDNHSQSDSSSSSSSLSHQRTRSRSTRYRSKPSSVNVVIPNPIDNNLSPQHHDAPTPGNSARFGYGKVRFVLLASGSLALFGNYYAFDNPAALNEPLREYMGMDTDAYAYFINLLYAVYSIPNIVMPWIGGYASDRFGHRRLLIATSLVVALGHLVVCLGLINKNVGTMYFGRVLFGAGETLSVTQAAITVKYFRGKELAMALGINLCISRLGSVLNDILTPIVWKSAGVVMAFWVGFVSCVVSCFSVFALVYFDRRYGGSPETAAGFQPLSGERRGYQHGMHEIARIGGPDSPMDSSRHSPADNDHTHQITSTGKYDPPPVPSNLPLDKRHELDGYREDIAMLKLHKSEMNPEDIELELEPANGEIPLDAAVLGRSPMGINEAKAQLPWEKRLILVAKDLVDYKQEYWVILFMIFLIVGVMVPFNSIHAGFLQMRWYPGDPQKAAQIMTVPDLLSSVLVLPFGFFVDHFGQKTWLFMITGLLVGFSHLTLGIFHPPSPIPALMALGVSSAIGALLTSVIPALVKERQIAQAYGMSTSAINLAFTIFPLVVAKLMTIDPTVYTYVEIFFASCGFMGFILAVRLKWLDKDGTLDKKEISRNVVVTH